MKIAVFASGNGSNFQVIAEQFPVEFVFSDHRDAYVLERAKNLGVTSHAFELKEFDNKTAYEEAIVKLLDEHQIDLVCLAGYMKIVGPTLLAAYEGRIINIHPAYLPEFPGAHGIEDAWNAGVDQSGVTIHWWILVLIPVRLSNKSVCHALKVIPLILSKLVSTKQSTSSIQKSWIVWELHENKKALELKDNF